ncbi:hypothetical protein [Streptomyces sp. NPDC006638]|uniref:hypothetical protein n=1 Tax=Streptomyces sp. NPDC006638 TaxID=3157183 RepID=UPI0033BC8E62
MTKNLRQTATTVANSLIDGASMAASLIGGAAGAYLGYELAPASLSDGTRVLVAGAVAVIGAIAIDGLAEFVLAPARRLMRGNVLTITRPAPAPASTLDGALAQVVTATEADAAHRAASAAFRIDQSENFLRSADRWRGYQDGEASFYLAPGVWLHHRTAPTQYGREPRFTLLIAEADQAVTITGIDQIRHRLAARATGLPLSEPATDDTELHAA